MKKQLIGFAALALSASMLFTGCGNNSKPKEDEQKPAGAEQQAEESKPAESPKSDEAKKPADGEMYIAVVSKGKQHQFWQAVEKGSNEAAQKYGVKITFEGPKSETDYEDQVKMLNSAMDQHPAAICLAALNTESVMDQLNTCKQQGLPVIGFDSGVPKAPEGSILGTVATNNQAAAGIGAEHLFKAVEEKVKAATAENPVIIGCVSQDQTSDSVVSRTIGFVDKTVELLKAAGLKDNEFCVTGTDKYKMGEENGAKVKIYVSVSATTNDADVATAATTILNMDNVVGIFGSNEQAAKGIIQATNEGVDLKEKGIVGVGFDAGERQKAVVKAGYFLGSVSQDPVQIGFQAVEQAVSAAKGEGAKDVEIPAVFYDASNMEQPEISVLLYD